MEDRISALIENRNFRITHDDVRHGFVSELNSNGVDDLLLCIAGEGRSPEAVKLLKKYGILAIALAEGYNGLAYLDQHDKVFKELRHFKRISTIFTYEEKVRVNGYYFGLRIHENFDHYSLTLSGLSIFH